MEKRKKSDGTVTINIFQKDDKAITCIGMIHIANQDYYQKVQKIIDTFEFGFFEGLYTEERKLSPERQAWAKKLQSAKPKDGMYISLASLFELTPQRHHITYNESWINADMSWEHFIETSPEEVLESLHIALKLFKSLKPFVQVKQENFSLLSIVKAIPSTFKLIKWLKFDKIGNIIKNNKDIMRKHTLDKRDKVACGYLQDWIQDTVTLPSTCAIVYGQSHMKGIQQYLVEQGFVCTSSQMFNAIEGSLLEKIFQYGKAGELSDNEMEKLANIDPSEDKEAFLKQVTKMTTALKDERNQKDTLKNVIKKTLRNKK